MSPDEVREEVRARLAGKVAVEGVCPRCHGSGRVTANKPVITQADLAQRIGTTRTSISAFLNGRQGFTMDVTLRLLDWLRADQPEPR